MPDRKLTTIDLPHKTMAVVSDILEGAGFTVGTVGGGYCEVEREGEISDEEAAKLTTKMAAAVFSFEVQDLEDNEEDPSV